MNCQGLPFLKRYAIGMFLASLRSRTGAAKSKEKRLVTAPTLPRQLKGFCG